MKRTERVSLKMWGVPLKPKSPDNSIYNNCTSDLPRRWSDCHVGLAEHWPVPSSERGATCLNMSVKFPVLSSLSSSVNLPFKRWVRTGDVSSFGHCSHSNTLWDYCVFLLFASLSGLFFFFLQMHDPLALGGCQKLIICFQNATTDRKNMPPVPHPWKKKLFL